MHGCTDSRWMGDTLFIFKLVFAHVEEIASLVAVSIQSSSIMQGVRDRAREAYNGFKVEYHPCSIGSMLPDYRAFIQWNHD